MIENEKPKQEEEISAVFDDTTAEFWGALSSLMKNILQTQGESETKDLLNIGAMLDDIKADYGKEPTEAQDKPEAVLSEGMRFWEAVRVFYHKLSTDTDLRNSVKSGTPDAVLLHIVDQVKQRRAGLPDTLFESAYIPILYGKPINEFMQASLNDKATDAFGKRATVRTKEGNKITIEEFDKLQGLLSTPAKKILDTACAALAKANFYRSKAVIPTVEISLLEFGEHCGYQLTAKQMQTPEEQAIENKRIQERIKDLKKNIRKNLHDLSSVLWTGEESKGPNKHDYKEMRIISSHGISKGVIRISFDPDAASYLVNAYVGQYPTVLLKHDNRNPNAYVIGRKISLHNCNDQNRAAGTENTLSVKSLLSSAPEIPTIEEITDRGQRNWKDKIKRPLESALDANVSIGLLQRWEYRNPRTGDTYSPKEASRMNWTQYSRLVVDFSVIDTPDQTERLAAKAEAKAKAAAEKGTPQRKRGRPPQMPKKKGEV